MNNLNGGHSITPHSLSLSFSLAIGAASLAAVHPITQSPNHLPPSLSLSYFHCGLSRVASISLSLSLSFCCLYRCCCSLAVVVVSLPLCRCCLSLSRDLSLSHCRCCLYRCRWSISCWRYYHSLLLSLIKWVTSYVKMEWSRLILTTFFGTRILRFS